MGAFVWRKNLKTSPVALAVSDFTAFVNKYLVVVQTATHTYFFLLLGVSVVVLNNQMLFYLKVC